MDAPRESLIRMVPLTEARAESDGNKLVGYPVLFDEMTEIHSWEGHFRERISPNALTKTLKERGDKVKVLYDHGFDPSIGNKPIAVPRKQEPDKRGLYVEADFIDRPYADDIRQAIAQGAIDGMSFRFSVTKEAWDDEPDDGGIPIRTIEELRLYEWGPVTFPAYEATTVGVRAREAFEVWRAAQHDSTTEAASGTSDEENVEPTSRSLDESEKARLRALAAQLRHVAA